MYEIAALVGLAVAVVAAACVGYMCVCGYGGDVEEKRVVYEYPETDSDTDAVTTKAQFREENRMVAVDASKMKVFLPKSTFDEMKAQMQVEMTPTTDIAGDQD